jgi:hypothetical protein
MRIQEWKNHVETFEQHKKEDERIKIQINPFYFIHNPGFLLPVFPISDSYCKNNNQE